MWQAEKTLTAINNALEADQGSKYRTILKNVLPHIGDAYRANDGGFRSHLGASVIGQECIRSVWYGYRWYHKEKFEGRMIRLFNRGHLEEGRIIALLLMIGVQVYQQDANGRQYTINHRGGLIGGSGDGLAVGLPDLQPGQTALLEFKTHSLKSYEKMAKDGVRNAKHEHYSQMQMYMGKMGLAAALYVAVCKDNDHMHMEIVTFNREIYEQLLQRAEYILDQNTAPKKINQSVGYWKCRFCSFKGVCHLDEKPAVNCRTCVHGGIKGDKWYCDAHQKNLDEVTGLDPQVGCMAYKVNDR